MWQKLTAALSKLRILRWRRTYPRSSRWGQYNTKGLHKREAGESVKKGEGLLETDQSDAIVGFENGGRSHEPRNASDL